MKFLAKGKKERLADVTLKEYLHEVNQKSRSSFHTKFARFCEMYGYDVSRENPFKTDPNNPNTEFQFKWEWYPVFKALFTPNENHPFYQRNRQIENIMLDEITEYYSQLLENIEEIPDYIQHEIKTHLAYQNTLKERYVLSDIAQKLAEFISAMQIITQKERPDLMVAIYKQLDEWIYNAFTNNYMLNLAKRQYKNENENIFKDMYLKSKQSGQSKELIKQLFQEEDYLSQYQKVSDLNELLNFLLKAKIISTSSKDHKKSQEILAAFSPNESQGKYSPEDDRQWYDLMYEQLINIPEEHKEHLSNIINNIKRCKYREQTAESNIARILESKVQFSREELDEERRAAKEKRRQELLDTISYCKEELEQLEHEDEFLQGDPEILRAMQQDYLNFCARVKEHSKKYDRASSSFFAQLVAPNLKSNTEK